MLLTLTQVTLGAEAGVAVGGLGRQYEAAVSVNATSLVKGNLLTDVQATSCYCVSKVRHFLDKFLLRSVCSANSKLLHTATCSIATAATSTSATAARYCTLLCGYCCYCCKQLTLLHVMLCMRTSAATN